MVVDHIIVHDFLSQLVSDCCGCCLFNYSNELCFLLDFSPRGSGGRGRGGGGGRGKYFVD